VTDNFSLFGSVGYTNSKITAMEDPSVRGNEAPLVSRTTYNLGAQLRQPISANLAGTLRIDVRGMGRTWWEPYNVTSRDPLTLVDARAWAVTAWTRNLFDKKYNAEFSPGGFLFKAQPRRYGVEFSYKL
jgi:iron complex outermembrane recepter protein